jgi:Tfp pilus assembly protein PilW
VELLIASAITLVVLGLMVRITFSTLQTFDKVTGTLNTKNQAQFIFDYLRRDFGSMVWRQDGNVWLLATVQPDQNASNAGRGDTNMSDADWSVGAAGTYKPGINTAGSADSSLRLEKPGGTGTDRWIDLSEYRFGQAGVWLRFFTNQITDSVSSAGPVAVFGSPVQYFGAQPARVPDAIETQGFWKARDDADALAEYLFVVAKQDARVGG